MSIEGGEKRPIYFRLIVCIHLFYVMLHFTWFFFLCLKKMLKYSHVSALLCLSSTYFFNMNWIWYMKLSFALFSFFVDECIQILRWNNNASPYDFMVWNDTRTLKLIETSITVQQKNTHTMNYFYGKHKQTIQM